MKIGLLQHFGTGNLGDDASVDAVMQQIKSRWPCALFIGLSLFPADSEERHGIPCFPIRRGYYYPPYGPATIGAGFKDKTVGAAFKRRLKAVLGRYRLLFPVQKPTQLFRELHFLAKSFRVAKSLDLLVFCGGGQLLDAWGGPWAFPYTLFKWVLLAKLAGIKCYFVNIGAGPLKYPLSKWFVKRALLFADYVSCRDDKSRALIREIGFSGGAQVVADCAYGLKISDLGIDADHARRESELIIGISPMAYRDPRRYWDKDQSSYQCFIRTLADFCARLIRRRHRLRLFGSDIWFDSQAIVDLEVAIKNEFSIDTSTWITCEPVGDIDELLSQLSQVDCLVTCKFHGVIFGHLLNVPVLAISHHPKVATLMDDFDLAEYCVDVRTFNADLLTKTFERLVDNINDIKLSVPEKAAFYRRELAIQFDQLFPSADIGLCARERRIARGVK
jgi:polysaccharide pyruvyl transferase WcaK-like protein